MINHYLTVILAGISVAVESKSIFDKLGEIEPKIWLFYLTSFLTIHIFLAVCLQRIAKKVKLENAAWLAWVPILQFALLAQAAGESSSLTWFFLVPILNIGLFTLLMLKASNRLGIWYKPDYLIFTISIAATVIPLIVHPLFLLAILLYLAIIAFKTEVPLSLSREVPLPLSGIVVLKCLGSNMYLDGRPDNGTVGLAPHAEDYTGTKWEVVNVGRNVISLKCLGHLDGNRYLDGVTYIELLGITTDGTVKLSPNNVSWNNGTKWEVVNVGRNVISLKCWGHLDGNRWLDGATADGTVGLAPINGGGYTGTRWQVQVYAN